MKTNRLRMLAFGVMLAIAASACTDDALPPSPSDGDGTLQTPTPSIAPSIETPAAELRAQVGSLLAGHIYLLGMTTATLLREGSESPELVRAQGILDDNTGDLVNIVSDNYGDDAGARFTDLWRAHIGLVSDYARGYDEADTALREQMESELLTFRDDLGALFDELTEGIVPTETATAALEPYFEGMLEVVDAQVAAIAEVPGILRETAGRSPEIADLLAGAIVAQFPDRYDASTEVPAANLRSTMWAQFQEHAYLAWLAIDARLRFGATSTTFTEAAATLDVNSRAIAETWGTYAGEPSGKAFLRAWRDHVEALFAYADGSTDLARSELEDFTIDLARIVDLETQSALDVETVTGELEIHVEHMLAAIDARTAGTRVEVDLVREAARHMPVLADVLATAIVQGYPEVFTSEG